MEIKPNFTMSYAELVQLGDRSSALIANDLLALALFGVSAADQTFISTETNALRNFPTDQELLGTQSILTAVKDENRSILKKQVSNIMIRIKIIFGQNSPQYNRYDTTDMHSCNDADMVRIADRVYRVAIEDFAALTTRGLTQQELDDMLTQNRLFDKSIDDKEKAVRDRDRAQQQRVDMANTLYAKIVEVFECGKAVFESDPARQNDYVIYDSPSKPEDKTKKAPPIVTIENDDLPF
jgi:hypothetical protein